MTHREFEYRLAVCFVTYATLLRRMGVKRPVIHSPNAADILAP
jgi:hypothetical protein